MIMEKRLLRENESEATRLWAFVKIKLPQEALDFFPVNMRG